MTKRGEGDFGKDVRSTSRPLIMIADRGNKRSISELGKARPDCVLNESNIVMDIQFSHDVALMGLDRLLADV